MLAPRNPTVSIVISVFRRKEFLRNAISSALGQTYDNIEVIIAEDGGSDCAAEIISSYSDPRLRLCRCEQNLGEAGNRVRAYRQARGRYLVNLDDDDALRPEFLESLLPPLEQDPELILAFSDHYVMDVKGRIDPAATEACTRAFGRDKLSMGSYDPLRELGLTTGTLPLNVATLFRAELIWPAGRDDKPALPDEAGAADDLYLTFLACTSGRPAYYIPKRLSEYRVHAGQLTTLRLPATSEGLLFCHRAFLRDPQLRPWRGALKTQLAQTNTTRGFDLLGAGNVSRARRCFAESLIHRPRLRSAAGLFLTLLPGSLAPRAVEAHRRGRHTPQIEETAQPVLVG